MKPRTELDICIEAPSIFERIKSNSKGIDHIELRCFLLAWGVVLLGAVANYKGII
ncbi:hypothetical protein [Vibrio barjaei]|uniref:hypothetical protein n=1 Tax=Vibrio barjaei TaxID=1676683 RepID=UPI0022847650|nr:hypothetical protein [Vibrio barjaei]MCY9874602.1 hypothetical protein [Vibrio barjaei]